MRRLAIHPDDYIEIRDRLEGVIISGGESNSSVEVEGALLRHPVVQEVAVVGMPERPKVKSMVHALRLEKLSLLFKLTGRRVNTTMTDEEERSDASEAGKRWG